MRRFDVILFIIIFIVFVLYMVVTAATLWAEPLPGHYTAERQNYTTYEAADEEPTGEEPAVDNPAYEPEPDDTPVYYMAVIGLLTQITGLQENTNTLLNQINGAAFYILLIMALFMVLWLLISILKGVYHHLVQAWF